MTSSPLVVASASIRSSSPRGRISRPRSAPACSIAVRMSVSISFSKTISPETACETLITVARSRCSTGATIVLVGSGSRLFLSEVRIQLVELPHLAIGAPTEIAVPGVAQVGIRDLLETACRVKPRGELVGDRLVVDKTVCVRRTDGLFVKLLGIERAAFDACDLRADQRGAVFEILRAMLRPYFELPVVICQRLEMLLSADREMQNPRMPRGKAHHKSENLRLRSCDGDVQSSRCALNDASTAEA